MDFAKSKSFIIDRHSYHIWWAVLFYCKMGSGRKWRPLQSAIVLIAAGAIGNMIDRFARGYVVDFFYFSLIHFPVFNVADCYVVVGAVIALLLLLFYYKEEDFAR